MTGRDELARDGESEATAIDKVVIEAIRGHIH